MTVSFKDTFKFFGIIVSMACAAFVCTLFLNYDLDLRAIGSLVPQESEELYEALKLNDIVVCAVSGCCLTLTSVVMLVFYIGHYIESNSAKFGILKALGYPDIKIAVRCAVFGFCVFIGVVAGHALGWAVMPSFYLKQNQGDVGLPEVALNFHPVLTILILLLPTLVFTALSVGLALRKLKMPALALIRGEGKPRKVKKIKTGKRERSFLGELSFNVLNDRKVLAFFVALGAFCFSAMTQMSLSMRTYASDMMGIMIMVIGLVLALVSLYLAMSTVVNGNKKKIAMLKITGYSLKECAGSVLGLYHIPAIIGFIVGAAYQYGILVIMVNLVFASFSDVPTYSFDWGACGICLLIFIAVYGLINLASALAISKSDIKSVMGEA